MADRAESGRQKQMAPDEKVAKDEKAVKAITIKGVEADDPNVIDADDIEAMAAQDADDNDDSAADFSAIFKAAKEAADAADSDTEDVLDRRRRDQRERERRVLRKTEPKRQPGKDAAKPDVSKETADEEGGDEEGDQPETETKARPKARDRLELTPEQQAIYEARQTDRLSQQARQHAKQVADLTAPLREIERLSGKPADAFLAELRHARAEQYAEERGITIAEAEADFKRQERLATVEAEVTKEREERMVVERKAEFREERMKYLSEGALARLAREYDENVSRLADGGAILKYEHALCHELGRQLVHGDLLKRLREAAEQSAVANLGGRKKGSAQTASQPGKATDSSLSAAEKAMAAVFDLSEEEYAKNRRAPRRG
jgi:hypothetical protein